VVFIRRTAGDVVLQGQVQGRAGGLTSAFTEEQAVGVD